MIEPLNWVAQPRFHGTKILKEQELHVSGFSVSCIQKLIHRAGNNAGYTRSSGMRVYDRKDSAWHHMYAGAGGAYWYLCQMDPKEILQKFCQQIWDRSAKIYVMIWNNESLKYKSTAISKPLVYYN